MPTARGHSCVDTQSRACKFPRTHVSTHTHAKCTHMQIQVCIHMDEHFLADSSCSRRAQTHRADYHQLCVVKSVCSYLLSSIGRGDISMFWLLHKELLLEFKKKLRKDLCRDTVPLLFLEEIKLKTNNKWFIFRLNSCTYLYLFRNREQCHVRCDFHLEECSSRQTAHLHFHVGVYSSLSLHVFMHLSYSVCVCVQEWPSLS